MNNSSPKDLDGQLQDYLTRSFQGFFESDPRSWTNAAVGLAVDHAMNMARRMVKEEANQMIQSHKERWQLEARMDEMQRLSDAESEAFRLAGSPANPHGEPVYAAEYAAERSAELSEKMESLTQ